jgi:hypothetical protein
MKISREKSERDKRRSEYNGLRSLPFFAEGQGKRWRFLVKQVKLDNKFAFEEDLKKRG